MKAKRRRPLPLPPAERWVAYSVAELAKFFGVTGRTIAQWRQDGMPGTPRAYDLAGVYAWKVARDKKNEAMVAERRKAVLMADPDHAYKLARARLMQLRVETEERALMPVEEFDRFYVRLCGTFRNGLFALAATLAAQLEGLDEHKRLDAIEAQFRDLLFSFSGPEEETAEGAGGAFGPDAGASATAQE